LFIIYLLASTNIYSLKVKRGVELTLSKSKDGALNVKSIDVVLEWIVAFPVAALQRVGLSLSGMVIGWARLLGRRYHSTDG